MIKIHLVRISPCCRVVWLYCLQNNIPVELVDVDLFGGDMTKPEYLELSPHKEIPILEDDDIIMYGACACLFYLAEKYTTFHGFGSNEKNKQMVKSLLLWANSELHSTIGYRTVYPNFIQKYQLKDDDDEPTEKLMEKGMQEVTEHLEWIENTLLASNKYLTGASATLADYYIATMILQLQWINFDFNLWPKLSDWLATFKEDELWNKVHEKHEGFVKELHK